MSVSLQRSARPCCSPHLLGLYESRAALAAGATLALVEGPLDALALTMAGDGHTVGVATPGTVLTDRQADLLSPLHPR